MNFFHSSQEKDKELFFGPLTKEDNFVEIQDGWLMAHLLKEAGIFPSVNEARKNGWNKPIPEGFTDLFIGKRKIRITIFKEK